MLMCKKHNLNKEAKGYKLSLTLPIMSHEEILQVKVWPIADVKAVLLIH